MNIYISLHVFILVHFSLIACSMVTVGEKLLIDVVSNSRELLEGDKNQSRGQWLEDEKVASWLFRIGGSNEDNRKILIEILNWGHLDVRELSEGDHLQDLERCGVFSTDPLTKKITQLLLESVVSKKAILEWVAHFLLESIIKIEGRKPEYATLMENFADNLNVAQKGLSGASSFLHILFIPNCYYWHDEDYSSIRVIINLLMGKCLERNADVNEREESGITALHVAAFLRDPAMCKFLLQHGAKPTKDRAGNTPLHIAIFSESCIMPGSVLGYDPDLDFRTDSSPLERKRVRKICKILKSCVNEKNNHGDTPLHRACMC